MQQTHPQGLQSPVPAASAAADRALVELLPAIARRFRPLGLFVAAFTNDGTLCFHDAEAEPFFIEQVLPNLQSPAPCQLISEPRIVELAEGILVAAITPALANRRRTHCLVLCAGAQAGSALKSPVYTHATLQAQANLLADMISQATRLSQCDRQLDSLSAQLANSYEELSLIYDISGGMKIDRKAEDFFAQVCKSLLDILSSGAVGVALRPGLSPAPIALYGRVHVPAEALDRLAADMLPMLSRRPLPFQANDLAANCALSYLAPHASQFLAVPLQRQEQVMGFLFALDKDAGEFDSSDAKLLTSIANESAIYLENVRLFDDVRSLVLGLMHSLTSAVDAKDAYTCGHSERVALLSRHLAAEAGLPAAEVEQVYMSALLHDVGKIGVPEAVLQKAGRLNDDEFAQMKKHPRIGARILADVAQVANIIPGVLHHHERYDGRGYPDGLAGKAIPIMGRIICLADSLDAMTSNRTYRRGLPLEVALAEIRRCSGTHFDPQLAEAMLRTSPEEFRELLRDHHQKLRVYGGLSKVA